MALKDQYPSLFHFFAGYFFDGWEKAHFPNKESPTYEDLVDVFTSNATHELLQQVINELYDLISLNLDEDQLLDTTLRLGLNIYPPAIGLTYQAWLERVLDLLEGSLDNEV